MEVDEKRELELNLIALAEKMWNLYRKWKPEGKYLAMKADHENEPYDIMVFDDDSLYEGRISELSVDKRLNRGLYVDTIHDGAGGFEFQHFNAEGRDVSPLYDGRKADKKDGRRKKAVFRKSGRVQGCR